MHSLYNFFVKTSNNKIVFIWSMFAFASFLILLSGIFIKDIYLNIKLDILIYAYIASMFFTLYQLLTGLSYSHEEGDLSVCYPLSVTGPLYIPFLAYFFIGEIISFKVFAGVFIIVAGAYIIQLKFVDRKIIFKINLKNMALWLALIAGFIYSFGAIIDKIGVGSNYFYIFTSWLVIFMFFNMTINILIRRDMRKIMLSAFKYSPFRVIISGFFLFISFFSYRYALQITKISYAAGVRQISVLFSVLIGVLILKENYGIFRIIGSILILSGIILIKLG